MSDHKDSGRRDFIKVSTGVIGSLIGVVVGIPAIDFLIGPAIEKADESAWVDLAGGNLAGAVTGSAPPIHRPGGASIPPRR